MVASWAASFAVTRAASAVAVPSKPSMRVVKTATVSVRAARLPATVARPELVAPSMPQVLHSVASRHLALSKRRTPEGGGGGVVREWGCGQRCADADEECG
jgi:hypothetical protein